MLIKMQGSLYLLSNPLIPSLLKIGRAEKIKERIKSLSTAYPADFKLEKSWKSNDIIKLETYVHKKLDSFRVSSDKEFFRIGRKEAIKEIDNIVNSIEYKKVSIKDNKELFKIKETSDIGKLIRTKRKKYNLTQERIAATCGVGRRFIVEAESGKHNMQIGRLLNIIYSLGLDIYMAERFEK